ncbi:guanylate kinase [Entophlyctis helioformis]|nr:guanylate kinase [Entophlyctis helioformis]
MVISGPSGSGKSTLLEKLFAKYPNAFGFSVSHTTRQPRPGETPGKSYHYITRDEFEAMVADNKFIEHAEFSGNRYGTSIAAIDSVKQSGKVCVLDLEIRGVQSIKTMNLGAKFVFVQPPSVEELEKRLRSRGTETEESLARRLQTAQEALDYAAQPGTYDTVIVNDDQDLAYAKLEEFVLATWPSVAQSSKKASKVCSIV